MELIPLHDERLIRRASLWLTEKSNRQWLDFGDGARDIDAGALKAMVHSQTHIIRAFTADDTGEAIGLVGLAGVNRDFRSAILWAVLGDRCYAAKGYVFRATTAMLSLGFAEYGLECVNAWAVECNRASLRILRKLNFTPIGRQRSCHYIDGRAFDRLLFELQATDHRSPPDVRTPFSAE
ncbi:MAG TPA: GNAT family protein [Gammaproteobacteria bacterium]|nr:GNAT family protein [Gammaproteobacteria bacterium]